MAAWITFQTEAGGMVTVRPEAIVAVFTEQNAVKLSTTGGGVHILAAGPTVHETVALIEDAEA